MAGRFRPSYRVIPTWHMQIEIVTEDGARVLMDCVVDSAQQLAGDTVQRMKVTEARFTPLPAQN
jgi:hypothetical protein